MYLWASYAKEKDRRSHLDELDLGVNISPEGREVGGGGGEQDALLHVCVGLCLHTMRETACK